MLAACAQIKAGDWLTILAGGLFTAWLVMVSWNGGAADRAIIRSGGKVFREVPLSPDQTISVPGPLGISTITIHDRQARISADPSPRQYCVRQGWLKQAGEIALCLPNEISVELAGRSKNYDSLNY
ncbi:MAG: NusG domain II-containing protein [Nitrosomonadales bacterium]|nr:NusG domain II-containing protein [Nitrosomonadales bacterium]